MHHMSPASAFEELQHAYLQRDRAAWKSRGNHIIGCLGNDVPEELLIAAGYLPLRIFGDPTTDSAIADRYLEQGFDALVRAQFARIVDGSYASLDHLVIANSSDALIRVFYYLRTLRQMEPDLPIPDLAFFDVLHTHFRTSALYNRDRLRDLKHTLESWRGQPVTREELVEAIAVCNENRRLIQSLVALRTQETPRVSGTQTLQIIGASRLLPREEHNRLLSQFLGTVADLPLLEGVRLFVTGSTHDHTAFYELVESHGAVIVGEDHDLGSRLAAGIIDTTVDPLDAIVDYYHLRPPGSSKTMIAERVSTLVEQVHTTRAQGVICFIHLADDPPSWDFPQQREALAADGIPVLLLDHQPYCPNDRGELHDKINAFIHAIRTHIEGGDQSISTSGKGCDV